MKYKCFKCDKELEKYEHTWLHDGMWFSSMGGFGSRYLDSLNTSIKIPVCDSCVKAAQEAGRVYLQRMVTKKEAEWVTEVWDGTDL